MATKRSLLSDTSLNSMIMYKANEKHIARSQKNFQLYMSEIYHIQTNPVIDSLQSVDGIPRHVFLSRMSSVTAYFDTKKCRINEVLDKLVSLIADNLEDETREKKIATVPEKGDALKRLCEIATNKKTFVVMREWLATNSTKLNFALIYCVSLEHPDLAQEACVAIAYLARQFHFHIMEGIESMLAGLVRAMAIAMVPLENHVELYREAKDRHIDLEMIRARSLPFHFPRLEYEYAEVRHRMIGFIYYTIADLLYSIPSTKLIHFFECRIFRRKEMTRGMLFKIFNAIAMNIPEIRAEAEDLSSTNETSIKGVQPEPNNNFNAKQWDGLPVLLYTELLRAYNDHNVTNKGLILDIMEMLRVHAPVKLAIFEDDALKALELYNARSSGTRGTDTMQIRKQSTAEKVDIGGPGKRLSIATQPTFVTQDTTKAEQDVSPTVIIVNEASIRDEEISYHSNDQEMQTLNRPSEVPDRLPDILNFSQSKS